MSHWDLWAISCHVLSTATSISASQKTKCYLTDRHVPLAFSQMEITGPSGHSYASIPQYCSALWLTSELFNGKQERLPPPQPYEQPPDPPPHPPTARFLVRNRRLVGTPAWSLSVFHLCFDVILVITPWSQWPRISRMLPGGTMLEFGVRWDDFKSSWWAFFSPDLRHKSVDREKRGIAWRPIFCRLNQISTRLLLRKWTSGVGGDCSYHRPPLLLRCFHLLLLPPSHRCTAVEWALGQTLTHTNASRATVESRWQVESSPGWAIGQQLSGKDIVLVSSFWLKPIVVWYDFC